MTEPKERRSSTRSGIWLGVAIFCLLWLSNWWLAGLALFMYAWSHRPIGEDGE